jgi:thioredoxin 1
MKRFIFLLLIVAALPWPSTALSVQAADPLGDSARKSGKPLIADFGMNQCKQCIKQTEAIDKFRPDAGDRLTLRFIHVAKEADLAGAYKIVLIPTLIFFDKQGKEVFRQVGLMPYDELRAKSRELGFLP